MKNEFEKQLPVQLEVLQVKNNTYKRSHLIKTISGIVGLIAVPSLASAAIFNDEEDRITAAKIEILPTDTINSPNATLMSNETIASIYVGATTIDTTIPGATTIDTTIPGATTIDTTIPGAATIDTTIPDTTPVSTTPETTLPLLGLEVQGYDNQIDNLIEPGEIVTYTVSVYNPDPIDKIINVSAGFKDSSAMSQIVDLRVSSSSNYINNSGPLNVNLENIVLSPGETCTLSYDVNIVFSGGNLFSYTQIYDQTTRSVTTRQFKTLYS